jgi:hypothetical protein
LFRSAGKKSDLASTLQANFPHLSVQSCKVSCKVFAAEMGRTMKRLPLDKLPTRPPAARRHVGRMGL